MHYVYHFVLCKLPVSSILHQAYVVTIRGIIVYNVTAYSNMGTQYKQTCKVCYGKYAGMDLQ